MQNLKRDIKEEAHYLVDNNCTIRIAAKSFGISKSTLHKDITKRLKNKDLKLYYSVRKVLDKNKAECHIRGGMATKLRYQKLKES